MLVSWSSKHYVECKRKNNGKRRRGDEVRFRDRIGNVTVWRVKSCILNLGLNKSDFCVMTRPSTTPKKCPSSLYMLWYVVPQEYVHDYDNVDAVNDVYKYTIRTYINITYEKSLAKANLNILTR